jgi:hypothetical protein
LCGEGYEVGNVDPSCALAWRGDLGVSGPKASGAIDAKATAYSNVWPDASGKSVAQCGPTHDDQPPFSWAAFPSQLRLGQPDLFDFTWVDVRFDE